MNRAFETAQVIRKFQKLNQLRFAISNQEERRERVTPRACDRTGHLPSQVPNESPQPGSEWITSRSQSHSTIGTIQTKVVSLESSRQGEFDRLYYMAVPNEVVIKYLYYYTIGWSLVFCQRA